MQQRMLVGLIGANIQKSLSPALFEQACASAGIVGHYHLMDLDAMPGRTLEDLLQAVRTAGFRGVNITYPCKEAVVPLLDDVSPDARQIGAVNTVVIAPDGKTAGYNTDRIGFRRAFKQELGASAVHGKTATLVGAGGAGRAVAFALLDLGAETLLVHDKRPDAAAALVEALVQHGGPGRAVAANDVEAALSRSAGIVNATPVGMLGIPGVPFPTDTIAGGQWVADVIYTPLETHCLKLAQAQSARTMGGAGMCVHQAAETFQLFTGLATDIDRMHLAFAVAAAERDRLLASATPPLAGDA
jgi:shikimate dehydrogenase